MTGSTNCHERRSSFREISITGTSRDNSGVTYYHIHVEGTPYNDTSSNAYPTKEVQRRFNDFKALHQGLTEVLKSHHSSHENDDQKCCWCWNATLPPLPPSDIFTFFRTSDPVFMEERRHGLESLIQAAEAAPLFRRSKPYQKFLDIDCESRVSQYLSLRDLAAKERLAKKPHARIRKKSLIDVVKSVPGNEGHFQESLKPQDYVLLFIRRMKPSVEEETAMTRYLCDKFVTSDLASVAA